MGVPGGGCIFNCWPNEGGIYSFFDPLASMAQILGEGGPGAFCFLDNGVNMVVEVELRVQVHTKIFGRSDNLQDVAMDGVRGFDWVTLVGNADDLTLGCVEVQLVFTMQIQRSLSRKVTKNLFHCSVPSCQ